MDWLVELHSVSPADEDAPTILTPDQAGMITAGEKYWVETAITAGKSCH